MPSKVKSDIAVQGGIIVFWMVFWLFNAIDKVVLEPVFLWFGENWVEHFVAHFASIGVKNSYVLFGTLAIITVIEFTASLLMVLALFYLMKGNEQKSRDMFFYGILVSLILFSLFIIGDNIFGERSELLAHSTYWIGAMISWFVYTRIQPITIYPPSTTPLSRVR